MMKSPMCSGRLSLKVANFTGRLRSESFSAAKLARRLSDLPTIARGVAKNGLLSFEPELEQQVDLRLIYRFAST